MVLERLHQMLIHAKFTQMPSDIRGIKMYYREYGQEIYVFYICDAVHGLPIGEVQYKEMLHQMSSRFYMQGYRSVEMLSILFTADVRKIKSLAKNERGVWFVDALRNTLMVYENQPGDFMAIRGPLEELLEQETQTKRAKISQAAPMNTLLVAANIFVYILLEMFGDTQSASFMAAHGAMYTAAIINQGEFYRLFTSMFMHFGMNHLWGNMITLALLGDNLERAYGKWRYLLIYMLGGLGASMCSFLYNLMMAEQVVAAGASGAIFGVIGALFYSVFRNKGRLEDLTLLRLGILIIYVIYNGITTPGIDNAAHIGGLVLGILLSVVLYPGEGTAKERKRKKR